MSDVFATLVTSAAYARGAAALARSLARCAARRARDSRDASGRRGGAGGELAVRSPPLLVLVPSRGERFPEPWLALARELGISLSSGATEALVAVSATETLPAAGIVVRLVAVEPVASPFVGSPRFEPRYADVFAKLRLWGLHAAGAARVVYLDADCLAVGRGPVEAFERVGEVDRLSAAPGAGVAGKAERGRGAAPRSGSHRALLPAGSAAVEGAFAAAPDVLAPDRFNAGVMVLEPSAEAEAALLAALEADSLPSYDGGDQGWLNAYFRGWFEAPARSRLPLAFNLPAEVASREPALFRAVCGDAGGARVLHFWGGGNAKPWADAYEPFFAEHGAKSGARRRSVLREKLGVEHYCMVAEWWAVYLDVAGFDVAEDCGDEMRERTVESPLPQLAGASQADGDLGGGPSDSEQAKPAAGGSDSFWRRVGSTEFATRMLANVHTPPQVDSDTDSEDDESTQSHLDAARRARAAALECGVAPILDEPCREEVRSYVRVGCPCVLRGQNWRCFRDMSLAALAAARPETCVRVDMNGDGAAGAEPQWRAMTLRQLAKALAEGDGGGNAKAVPYLRLWSYARDFPSMAADADADAARLCAFVDRSADVLPRRSRKGDNLPPPPAAPRWLFAGAAGTKSPLHVDPWLSHAWFAQLAGTKRFALYPPEDAKLLHDGTTSFVDADELIAAESCSSARQRLEAAFPGCAGARRVAAVVRPGELLVLPANWAHAVWSEEEGEAGAVVSLTHNFMDKQGAASMRALRGRWQLRRAGGA